MLFWFSVFIASAVGVIRGGVLLERVTDEWAERSGVTKEWAGFLILSIVTSTPELATALSGAIEGYPDIVVGDILGGNLLNITLFSVLSLIWYDLFKSINKRVFYELITWSMVFTVIIIVSLYLDVNLLPVYFLYPLIVMRLFERSEENSCVGSGEKGKFVIYFIVAILIVVISGYLLIVSGGQLSRLTGLSNTFVGTLFVAIVTSAPELSTSFSALLRKAHGLCVGNILGSNMLNFFVLPLADLFFKGSIIKASSEAHLLTALSGLIVSFIVVLSIYFAWKSIRAIPVLIYLLTILFLGKGV